MRFSIREVEPADVPGLVELDRLSVEDRSIAQVTIPRPGIDLVDLIRSNGHPQARCFIAEDHVASRIVGFAFLDVEHVTWNGGEITAGYLFHFRVHPAHRRQGIATALASYMEALALSQGAQLIWAAVVQGNDASRTLFRSRGYGYGTRIEYTAVPLVLARVRSLLLGRTTVHPARADGGDDVNCLRESYWHAHQLWAPRRYPLATRTYTALGPGGDVVAVADCFEEYKVARVTNLGMKGVPPVINQLLGPIANRLASRYVFVRDMAFTDTDAAVTLVASLVDTYRGKADFLVVGADARSDAQCVVRRLPGVSGWVDILVKTGKPIDPSRSYHMVLG